MPYEILIAHNDKQTAETIQDILRKNGNRVTLVRDIQRAFRLVEKKVYDLVISDLELSGQSGLEVLERNRALHPLWKALLVILPRGLQSLMRYRDLLIS